ncbi:MAG: methionyl-tRNA formyltransferase, partial [Hylemonella sp.]
QASYEGWFRSEESRINWHNHVDQVYNLIRSCNPAPGAWCELAGQKVFIYDCLKHPVRRFAGVKGKPGEVVDITATSILINAQGGMIEVLRLKPEGGKKMDAASFAQESGLGKHKPHTG